jgi:hypothetical protein
MRNSITPATPEDSVMIQERLAATYIWVTFDRAGFHCYPDAPDEVAYLRSSHRHVFKFKVTISVFHDDREIEFHMFKNWLTSLYHGQLNVDYKSCEMLAQDLLSAVLKKYNCTERRVVVDVSEDGECGAAVVSDPCRPVALSKEWILQQAEKLAPGYSRPALTEAGREFP